ncbi:conserved hypothetical protein [Carnobacterium maltaromaticum]|nr:conserved hypothetical protein [Carnobacterium maltaromaticum]
MCHNLSFLRRRILSKTPVQIRLQIQHLYHYTNKERQLQAFSVDLSTFLKEKNEKDYKNQLPLKKSFPSFNYPVQPSLYSSLFIVEIFLTSYFTVYLINKKSTI